MTVTISLSLRCAGCAAVVPLNAYGAGTTCWSCARRTEVDPTTWKLLLDAPLRDAATLAPNIERDATLQTSVGAFHRAHRGGDPACTGCRGALPADALRGLVSAGEPAKTAHCPQCNHGVLVRGAPPELVAVGVAVLVGESADELSTRREPVPIACTACGGSLPVDGSTRAITCTYCSASQYLPDALWISLSSRPVVAWSLVLAEGAAAAHATERAAWTMLYDVIADREGNLYGAGLGEVAGHAVDPDRKAAAREAMRAMMSGRLAELGGVPGLAGLDALAGASSFQMPGAVWSMTASGELRWLRTGIALEPTTFLAWAPSGHLLVASGAYTEMLSTRDGSTSYRFGVDSPALEVGGARSLAIDADGSIVWIDEDGHLLRADPRGVPIAMWGAGARATRAVTEHAWVFDVTKKPTGIKHARLAPGWDGRLWMQSTIPMQDSCHVTSFDRAGARGVVASVPIPWMLGIRAAPACDAAGNVFVLGHHDVRGPGGGHHLFRVAAGAHHGVPVLGPQSAGGVLGDESKLCAFPDGTFVTVGSSCQMRRFRRDGLLEFLSEGSLAADRSAAG